MKGLADPAWLDYYKLLKELISLAFSDTISTFVKKVVTQVVQKSFSGTVLCQEVPKSYQSMGICTLLAYNVLCVITVVFGIMGGAFKLHVLQYMMYF